MGAAQTCRGSHTHSVVSGPGDDGKIVTTQVLLASESARRWKLLRRVTAIRELPF